MRAKVIHAFSATENFVDCLLQNKEATKFRYGKTLIKIAKRNRSLIVSTLPVRLGWTLNPFISPRLLDREASANVMYTHTKKVSAMKHSSGWQT